MVVRIEKRENIMLVLIPNGDILEMKISQRIYDGEVWFDLEVRRGGHFQVIQGTSHLDANKMFNDVADLIKDLESGKSKLGTEYGKPIVLLNWRESGVPMEQV